MTTSHGGGPPTGGRPAPWAVAAASASAPVPPGPAPVPPGGGLPPGGPAPRGRARRGALIAVLLVLCPVASGGAVYWFLQQRGEAPAAVTASATTAPSPSPEPSPVEDEDEAEAEDKGFSDSAPSEAPDTEAPPDPDLTSEVDALAQLEGMRAQSRATLVLDGRWVAQVASKYIGIVDRLQVAANGTNTFQAFDILVESQDAAARAGSSDVLVLHGTDFGKRSVAPDGSPFWVTLVDAGFSSSEEVDAWCAQTYSDLTPEQLRNACAARTLSPPHD